VDEDEGGAGAGFIVGEGEGGELELHGGPLAFSN
jgi:hypothetical protein